MSDIGRYRRAFPRLFRHPGFKGLPPLGQRLTVYLLFGPQSNRIGLFYFSANTAAEDLATTAETLRKALANVQSTFGWDFDAAARVFYIPTWWRWNHPDHGKVLLGNLKDLSEIPPCGLVDAFAANLAYLTPELHETFVEAIRIRLREAPRSQEQYQGSGKQKQEPALRAVKSLAPSATSLARSETKNEDEPDENHIAIARQALTFTNPSEPMVDLLDVFHSTWQAQPPEARLPYTKAQATKALSIAISEQRA